MMVLTGVMVLAGAGCRSAAEQGSDAAPGSVALVDLGTARPTSSSAAATEGATRSAARDAEPFHFTSDLPAGLERASREKRPMLLFFSAEWNLACKELGKVFASPRFAEAASRFVGVRLDFTDDEKPEVKRLQDAYRTRGLPTVILLDENGKETHRFESYEPEETWLARLAQMK